MFWSWLRFCNILAVNPPLLFWKNVGNSFLWVSPVITGIYNLFMKTRISPSPEKKQKQQHLITAASLSFSTPWQRDIEQNPVIYTYRCQISMQTSKSNLSDLNSSAVIGSMYYDLLNKFVTISGCRYRYTSKAECRSICIGRCCTSWCHWTII